MSSRHSRRTALAKGFTIVELLIVIIVIAVLAAITIVAYNGVQQRANNAAIIDAASKSYRMIEAYVATNGVYPVVPNYGQACITSNSGCVDTGIAYTADTTFDTSVATIGTLPRSVPKTSANFYGIYVYRNTDFMYNGVKQPYMLQYFLIGAAQPCGLPVTTSDWPSTTTSTTGYTGGPAGITWCRVSISGPTS